MRHTTIAGPAPDHDATVVRRIRKLIENVGFDCSCRTQLDEALARFTTLEDRRMQRQQLVRARQQRERIRAILDFLQEIDDLLPSEPDASVYTELALLFEEVAAVAGEGAASMHRLAALRQESDGESGPLPR